MKILMAIIVTFVCFITLILTLRAVPGKTRSELNDTRDDLTNTVDELLIAKEYHSNKIINLTDIMEIAVTDNDLMETEYTLSSVNTGFKSEQDKNNTIPSQYTETREQIYLRQGENVDKQAFITPENPLLSARVKNITGEYSNNINEIWTDYKRLYDWIVDNIEYSYDSGTPILPISLDGDISLTRDFWRMPEETIVDGTGDCEDMAVLLASMLLCYNNNKYEVWSIGIRNDDTGHIAVAFPVAGDKLTVLDPAGHYYTGWRTGRLASLDAESAINDWLSYWFTKIPDANISCVFSDDFVKEFSAGEEFIEWFKER